jgi:hypothetical protein
MKYLLLSERPANFFSLITYIIKCSDSDICVNPVLSSVKKYKSTNSYDMKGQINKIYFSVFNENRIGIGPLTYY